MPLEHRWEDLQTPLGSVTVRERRVLKLAAALFALAVLVTLLALFLIRPGKSQAGCLSIVGASTMGASEYHACGGAAVRFCAGVKQKSDQQSVQMATRCRQAGFD